MQKTNKVKGEFIACYKKKTKIQVKKKIIWVIKLKMPR